MRPWIRQNPWISHVAVCIGYFVGYQLLRGVSVSHWLISDGLRLGCVMFLPRRYWPALVAGEVAALAPISMECLAQYGWVWSLAHLFPPITFVMPVVWLLRDRLPPPAGKPFQTITATHMVVVLLCAAWLTLTVTLDNLGLYYLSPKLAGYPPVSFGTAAGRYLLGHYLGCLTLVPLAMAAYEGFCLNGNSWRRLARRIAGSRLLLEGAVLTLASFGVLTVLGATSTDNTWRQAIHLCMFLPAAWLTVRYGWKGAAVGASAASTGIFLAMPALYDPSTITAQTYMAFAMTLLLPLGAHIGSLRHEERNLVRKYYRAQQIARREVYQCELRLRRMSEMLERSHGELQLSHGRLLHRLRFALSSGESMVYRQELQAIRQRIYRAIDSLAPRDWQKHDLTGALWNGPITQALDEVGVAYYVRDPEGSLNELPPDLRLALFRLACEAVAYLLGRGPLSSIRLRLRGGRTREGRGWAVLIAQGELDTDLIALGAEPPSRQQVESWLGASGLDLDTIRDRVSLYDGKVHTRQTETSGQMSILLKDTAETAVDFEEFPAMPELV